ncbi:MAG: hypothetical protein AB2L22_01665 [Syntrophales bacterium]
MCAIPLAWLKELQAKPAKPNVNEGALAPGSPVGNPGCRLIITQIHKLRSRQDKYTLVSL